MGTYSEGSGILAIEGPEYKLEQDEEFRNSYFRHEYFQAYRVVETIVNRTLCRKEDRSEIQNIVPFIGKRGSGKTSVMMSFVHSLNNYMASANRKSGQRFYTMRQKDAEGRPEELQAEFTCIGCIDGSLLEQREDIFKIILAQMYAKFEEEDRKGGRNDKNYDYYRRELQKQFDEIYRSAQELEPDGRGGDYYEESGFSSLKHLSSSLTIKNGFRRLVRLYLQLMSGKKPPYLVDEPESLKQFLVVSIDDLDLNIKKGFEMLEKIHRYMMVDNVIILLAVDYEQLKLLSEHSFYKMVPKYDRKLNEKDREVERLARDFLDKVLSAGSRIYIPDLRKVTDAAVLRGGGENQDNTVGLKAAVFKELYLKLGMRMDPKGEKRHFYEQNSLRAFVNFYLMLTEMENLSDAGGEFQKELYDGNYKVLMSDTMTRMLDERTAGKYKEMFLRITERRMPYPLRSLYYEAIRSEKEMERERFWDGGETEGDLRGLVDNLEFYGYSYGEVLRTIYCWGRVDTDCKEMIRCLLAYYSLELSHSYHMLCCTGAGDGEKGSFTFLMNGSVVGSWANKMLPRIKEGPYSDLAGARIHVDMSRVFRFEIPSEILQQSADGEGRLKLRDLFRWTEAGGTKEGPAWEETGLLEEIRKLFRSVLVLGMFFEQQYYKADTSFTWDLQLEKKSREEARLAKTAGGLAGRGAALSVANSGGTGRFNLFSFVSASFRYEKSVLPLMDSLYNILFSDAGDQRDRTEFFSKLGLGREFADWTEYSKGFALPVYDMDVCYNLVKRVRLRKKRDGILQKDVLEEIRAVYAEMEGKLGENDSWYGSHVVSLHGYGAEGGDAYKGHDIRFADAFSQCPFVRWIRDPALLLDDFPEMFRGLVHRLLIGANSNVLDDSDEIDYSGYDD